MRIDMIEQGQDEKNDYGIEDEQNDYGIEDEQKDFDIKAVLSISRWSAGQAVSVHDFLRPTYSDMDPNSSSWLNIEYKAAAMASFVQGVYLIEEDTQAQRSGAFLSAPIWWESLNYKLRKTLLDNRDGSVFAAVYEWDVDNSFPKFGLPMIPNGAYRLVLAFRGTYFTRKTISTDIVDDIRTSLSHVHTSHRVTAALECVRALIAEHGPAKIAIAGHSLGGAIALTMGMILAAKDHVYVATYAFNPPAIALPKPLASIILSAFGVKGAAYCDTGVLSLLESLPRMLGNEFLGLGQWVPTLYIHRFDRICSGYLELKRRDSAEESGEQKSEPVATRGAFSAYILMSEQKRQGLLGAHALEHWWKRDLKMKHHPMIQMSQVIRQLNALKIGPQNW